ncbi:hypothetical protein [Trichloromonas sp.]|uniref:hypothetical protein n=1 Tax=Trichloromonas sp. TaxID=3069249 RepID=UPI003D8199A3
MSVCYLLSLNPTSYGIYKNLRNAGLHLHLFHMGGGLESFLGRDITVHRLSVDEEPEAVVVRLLEIQANAGNPGFVFTSSDGEVAFLDRFRDSLQDVLSLPIPTAEVARLVNDKHAFAEKLKELGIRIPWSFCVERANVEDLGLRLSWPCLVKPVVSSEWKTDEVSSALGGKKAFVVDNYDGFFPLISRLHEYSPKLLVQEIIDVAETGNFSFCCYSDANGKVIWGFVTQKLLQYPECFGTAILCSTVEHPEIASFGKEVIEALGVSGISETEIVVDRKTGKLFVIEINTRHWLQHRLSTRLGVNISLLDYYYRSENIPMVNSLVSKDHPFKKVLLVDDYAYLMHFVKNIFRYKKLLLPYLYRSTLEFSTFERRQTLTFLKFINRKLFSF